MKKQLLALLAAAALTLPVTAVESPVTFRPDLTNGYVYAPNNQTGGFNQLLTPNYRGSSFPNGWGGFQFVSNGEFYFGSKYESTEQVDGTPLLTFSCNGSNLGYINNNDPYYNGWEFAANGTDYTFTVPAGYYIKSISFDATHATYNVSVTTPSTISDGTTSIQVEADASEAPVKFSYDDFTHSSVTLNFSSDNAGTKPNLKVENLTVVIEESPLITVTPDLNSGLVYYNNEALAVGSPNFGGTGVTVNTGSRGTLTSLWGITFASSSMLYFGQHWKTDETVDATPLLTIYAYNEQQADPNDSPASNIGYITDNGSNVNGWVFGSSGIKTATNSNGVCKYRFTVPDGYAIKAISFNAQTIQRSDAASSDVTIAEIGGTASTTVGNASATTVNFNYDSSTQTQVDLSFTAPQTTGSMVKLENFSVSIEKPQTSGIGEITVEDGNTVAPCYFNLLGVEVQNPTSGLYIRVCGDKATKVLLK